MATSPIVLSEMSTRRRDETHRPLALLRAHWGHGPSERAIATEVMLDYRTWWFTPAETLTAKAASPL
jgi:hypothetical protein